MARKERLFGWTYADLEKITGISTSALKARVSRGLKLDDVFVFMEFVKKNRKEYK